MTKKLIPTELVSLIHHIELNESGWWKKAVAQRIKYILWSNKESVTPTELTKILKATHHIEINYDEVENHLKTLISQQEVSQLPDRTVILSETTRSQIDTEHNNAKNEQAKCKETFTAAVRTECPHLDQESVWQNFTHALSLAIKTIGANTFRLLQDGNLRKESDWLENFLEKYESDRESIKKVISVFFSPHNKDCRAQVLRMMSMHFFLEASNLSRSTIEQLEKKKKPTKIKVILDTNFIFSLLNLHDNPANDAAMSLLELAKKTHKLELKLYVIPNTIDEAQRTIAAHVSKISSIKASKHIYQAAQESSVSGIAAKFIREAAKNPEISAEEYFLPYIHDLKIILKDKGIEVFDAPPSLWNVHQDVVDDITKELELESKYPPKKQKGYETLRHDIVLWHVVESRRNKPETSPIDTEIWAVSIDWRLIGFDQRKRKISNSTVPAVIYPTNLVQLLQFWVPRSENLESTMIDSLQLPLFFQKFDKDDETATLKILETLSRFENHNDISTESAAKILKNRSLRKRIQESDFDTEKTISLIREELLAENEKANTHISHLENRILLEKKERENEKTAHKKQLLDEKEKNLKAIQQQKEKSEIQADKKFSAYKKYLITGITIYYLSILGLTLHYGWDIAEMYTWISSIAPIFIGLIYQVNQEKPFDLIALFDKKRENLLNNQYIENRFSIFEYEKLIEEINLIKQELKP